MSRIDEVYPGPTGDKACPDQGQLQPIHSGTRWRVEEEEAECHPSQQWRFKTIFDSDDGMEVLKKSQIG